MPSISFDQKLTDSIKLNATNIIESLNDYFDTLANHANIDIISEIMNINNYFITHELALTPDVIITLIKQNKFLYLSLKKFVDNNLNSIKTGRIYTIVKDELAITMIEIVCSLNDITIDEDGFSNIKNIDCFDSDILKMYLKEVRQISPINSNEEKILIKRISEGDEEAKKTLINHNLHLVISIAKKFLGKNTSFLDLIQAGNIGLISAANKFNQELGIKFSAYASCCIKNDILNEIYRNNKRAGISRYMSLFIGKYQKVVAILSASLNREPTIDEIATELNVPVSRVLEISKYQYSAISLDEAIGTKNRKYMRNFIIPNTSYQKVEKENLKKEIKFLLDSCDLLPEEKQILILRYGLFSGEPMKLADIGKIYGVSRERISQREAIAYCRIRSNKLTDKYIDYADNPDIMLEKLEQYREIYKDKPRNRLKIDPLRTKDERNILVKKK